MKIEVCKRLRDIADGCAAAGRFATGKAFSDYLADDMLRSPIERKLGIIGEAFVDRTGRAEDADLDVRLQRLKGLRNRQAGV